MHTALIGERKAIITLSPVRHAAAQNLLFNEIK